MDCTVLQLQLVRARIVQDTKAMVQQVKKLKEDFLQDESRKSYPVQALFKNLDQIVSSFQTEVETLLLDPFQRTPDAIIDHIFSFLPYIVDIGRSTLVCKRFHSIVKRNDKLWRNPCLLWWENRLPEDKKITVPLERIATLSAEPWRYFARCFVGDKWHSLSCVVGVARCRIGHIQDGKIVGKGIEVWNNGLIEIGHFTKNILHGKSFYKNGHWYEGQYKDGVRHGIGTYYFGDDNFYLQGEWKSGQKHGEGIFRCKDGFKFSDPEKPIHPALKDVIKRDICTYSCGDKTFPQFLWRCFVCKMDYCQVCYNRCHPDEGHPLRKMFFIGNNLCQCGERGNCIKMEPPNKKIKVG